MVLHIIWNIFSLTYQISLHINYSILGKGSKHNKCTVSFAYHIICPGHNLQLIHMHKSLNFKNLI
jgi:hypothetical protein